MAAIDPFTRRVIVAVSIAALFYIGWQLDIVFMLLFGGLILAIALRSLADLLGRAVSLGERGALAAVVLGILAVLTLLGWLTGGLVATQFAELRATLPKALEAATRWLQTSALDDADRRTVRQETTGLKQCSHALGSFHPTAKGPLADIHAFASGG